MPSYIKVLLLLGFFMSLPAFANWNLPYPRPAKYDYSDFYHPSVKSDLVSNPNFFKAAMTKGWAFYKQNFIMQNGLVNHRRGDIGANEAVSEGQGYGMLLALLNNDQATFNRIFEAANQHMWNSGRKSYFIWDWPSNKTGAATDADLDIGLALVFADALREGGHWQNFNKGGVTYKSRAMEIIKSLRQNMTAENYLLPGDSWGQSGLRNLNPSYFGTGALRVFNDYQNEVDFRPVIATCYQILKKMPQYSKGQAPDWITKDGGKGDRGSLDMGADAIRTPFRIAQDALWYNSPDAIQYCKNTKGTLTAFNNENANFLLAQMGYYNANGRMQNGTAYFENAAMWGSGILGSKDKSYTQPAFRGTIFLRIIGDGNNFGSTSLQDHKYYYKQSLGLLGFALMTGQFPNVLDDMRNPVSVKRSPLQDLTILGKQNPRGPGVTLRVLNQDYSILGRRIGSGLGIYSSREDLHIIQILPGEIQD